MANKERPLHELIPVHRQGKAYVWRGSKWVYLGKWEENGPSKAATDRLAGLKNLWTVDPKAMAKPKSDLLFVELWLLWMNSSEGPSEKSQRYLGRAARLLFGTVEVDGPYLLYQATDFTARDLKSWQSHLCSIKNGQGELRFSRDTVRRCVKLVRQCFSWGVVEGKVDQLHAAALTLVESPGHGKVKEGKKRSSIDKATSDKVLPLLSPPLRAAIELLWLTTSRPSEVLGLKVGDIRQTGSLLLRGGGQIDLDKEGVWAAVIEEHKTAGKGFERVMFFGPKSQAILQSFITSTGYLFKPSDGRAHFITGQAAKKKEGSLGSRKPVKGEKAKRKPGEFYTYGALGNAVAKACKKLAISRWFPYQIRITASAAIMDSHGSEAAGVYMGHRPRGVTGGYVGGNLRLAAKVARDCG